MRPNFQLVLDMWSFYKQDAQQGHGHKWEYNDSSLALNTMHVPEESSKEQYGMLNKLPKHKEEMINTLRFAVYVFPRLQRWVEFN